jgi:LPXTG-motif cell wall-anchored protein
MRSEPRRLAALVGACVFGLGIGTAWAQQPTVTKSSETKAFEVIEVHGNKVVAKTADGTKEYTIPEDFRFTVGDKQISVHELKPGMKGTATITSITTSTPVTVTEVRNGTVMRASGSSVTVRTDNGIQMFTQHDANERGVTIMRAGREATIADLRAGDHLTATIVTTKPPEVVTQQQVDAMIKESPSPAAATKNAVSSAAQATEKGAAAAGSAVAAGAKATAKGVSNAASKTAAAVTGGSTSPSAPSGASGAGEAPKKTLPKTASELPLIGLVGVLSLALAAALTVRRRRIAG